MRRPPRSARRRRSTRAAPPRGGRWPGRRRRPRTSGARGRGPPASSRAPAGRCRRRAGRARARAWPRPATAGSASRRAARHRASAPGRRGARGRPASRACHASQVGRRGADHAPVVGQPACDQAVIGQRAHAHGAVDAGLDEVDEPVAQRQVDRTLRMPRRELGDERARPSAGPAPRWPTRAACRAPARRRRQAGRPPRRRPPGSPGSAPRYSAPLSVRLSRRELRCSSRTPRRASSRARRLLATAGDRPSSRPAADRLPAATARTKRSMSCRSVAIRSSTFRISWLAILRIPFSRE